MKEKKCIYCNISYKHPAVVSSDVLADPSSPSNSWASCKPWFGCHCNYIVTQRQRANKICKRERERIHTKGRVGGEGSGANCAHDSIRAVGREREPASKQGFLFPCSACASFRKREGAVRRVVCPFSWNSLTKQSGWYLQTGRKSASMKTKKVEWAEESDRGKHPWNSAIHMLQEMGIHSSVLLSEIKLKPALSWSRAASTAASPAIMCFYLWDTWSDLAGDPQSWTLDTVSMCCVCSVCLCQWLLIICRWDVARSLCLSQLLRFGLKWGHCRCYNCLLSWHFSLLLFVKFLQQLYLIMP